MTENSASNMFMVERRDGSEFVTSAKSASVQTVDGERFAVLQQGQRVENELATQTLKLTHFDTYQMLLQESPAAQTTLRARALSVPALLANPTPVNMGELAWRIGLPLAALNLALLGLAITKFNPRAGKSASLVLALVTFVVYYNLITVGQSWVASGRISMPALIVLMHGGIFALGCAILMARHYHWHPRMLWQRTADSRP